MHNIECYSYDSIRGEKRRPARALAVPTSTPRKRGPVRLRGVIGMAVVISMEEERWRGLRESTNAVLSVIRFAPYIILALFAAICQDFRYDFYLFSSFFSFFCSEISIFSLYTIDWSDLAKRRCLLRSLTRLILKLLSFPPKK